MDELKISRSMYFCSFILKGIERIFRGLTCYTLPSSFILKGIERKFELNFSIVIALSRFILKGIERQQFPTVYQALLLLVSSSKELKALDGLGFNVVYHLVSSSKELKDERRESICGEPYFCFILKGIER